MRRSEITEEKVLTVSSVGKKFSSNLRSSLANGVRDVGREVLGRPPFDGLRSGEFWALQDVSLELRRGEALAVMGPNGAGKTTLLRLLYGVLKPDCGEIRIRGRTNAIIALGTGFDETLTGRENITLAAAIHDHPPSKIPELLEQVVDFAELGDFVDAPLHAYSSGMASRLAYSLSAHLNPDLLLVDEVLAVGDLAFQHKCVSHMRRYLAGGGALVVVSHNVFQMQTVFERGLLLDRGRVAFEGPVVETIDRMYSLLLDTATPAPVPTSVDGPVRIEGVTAEPVDGGTIETGRPLRLRLRYSATERCELSWAFSVWTADSWVCVTGAKSPSTRAVDVGSGEFGCLVPQLPLIAGRYGLRAALVDPATDHAVSRWGWENPPTVVTVHAPPATYTNTQRALQQLTTVDVTWDES